jgi:hypothetical protein
MAEKADQQFCRQPDRADDQAYDRRDDLDHPEIIEDIEHQSDHDQQRNQPVKHGCSPARLVAITLPCGSSCGISSLPGLERKLRIPDDRPSRCP